MLSTIDDVANAHWPRRLAVLLTIDHVTNNGPSMAEATCSLSKLTYLIAVPAPLGIEPNTATNILRKHLKYLSDEGLIDMIYVLGGLDQHSQRPNGISIRNNLYSAEVLLQNNCTLGKIYSNQKRLVIQRIPRGTSRAIIQVLTHGASLHPINLVLRRAHWP